MPLSPSSSPSRRRPSLSLHLYALVMWLAQPLLRRKLARRARAEPGYAEAVPERFGFYTQASESVDSGPALIWVHAVSLGETRTAAILLKALRAERPDLRLLLTHGTATGRAEGKALLRPGDIQVWQPWDSRAAVARFLDHFKPGLGVLLETEIWPNLMAATRVAGLPVVLVNARMSEKSLRQALRLPSLALPAFGALQAVYAQTEPDAQRLRQLTAPVVAVCGNLKFDATPDPAQQVLASQWKQRLRRPVLMLASSREGEEAEFLRQWLALKRTASFNMPQVLIVPRHPQRFDDVQKLIEQSGLTVSRRSQWPSSQTGSGGPAESEEALCADVWLGDSLGEMALYYSLSSVALLGGSFEPLGGQNLIEPAASGCPVVMGPHTFNFAEVAQLAEAEGAALRVPDMTAAISAATALLQSADELRKVGDASLAFTARHRGATGTTVAGLSALLPSVAG